MEVQLHMPNSTLTSPRSDSDKRVLLVDQSDDSRDVLRTMLERRGVEIFEAPSAQAGLELARRHRPDVVVLDLEAQAADGREVASRPDHELETQAAEIVILGNLRRGDTGSSRHVVRKPYHYGPLIQMIEQLVSQSRQ